VVPEAFFFCALFCFSEKSMSTYEAGTFFLAALRQKFLCLFCGTLIFLWVQKLGA
jgi:hypothetical protein